MDENLPICEKHGYKGYDCLQCRMEKIAGYENLKLISMQMANCLESLLLAIEITETEVLLPNIYTAGKIILEEFKKINL